MRSARHPHRHVDPRQPRQDARPRTNPPVFAFKPPPEAQRFRIVVARDEAMKDIVCDWKDLAEPLCLPERAFVPGRYFWTWRAEGAEDVEVFRFEIPPDAVTLEVPPVRVWLRHLPKSHPRTYIRREALGALRDSRSGPRAALWKDLQADAEELLQQPHEIEEPPFLPDWSVDYKAAFAAWYKILFDSRRFAAGAETLGLAYLASGEERYGRAACRRLASLSRWDPAGSSHIEHNDEAHMSLLWHGPQAIDFAWDCFTDEERALVIDQFRRRGQITFEHMHGKRSYGVTRFDSHAGREIVFLAQIALVLHEHIPEAEQWLDWLRPVLCGIWPIWAGDDGGWAEGPSYAQAYVGIMTQFATSLKQGAGIDLYKRPFWKGHAEWRRWIYPSYGEWYGFGDHTERWGASLAAGADLVETIDRQLGGAGFGPYVAELRKAAETAPTPEERKRSGVSAQCYLLDPASAGAEAAPDANVLKVFPTAGWAAIRTDFADPAKDLAFFFRSSPYGSVSHSHANHNDFILHAGGKVLAMPSGYYDGYGSRHHAHWVWHTKSHNCLTLSDAPQIMRSSEARGAVEHPYEDAALAYLCGNADTAYADRALRCRRHVVFLKTHGCFVLLDEFRAKPGLASAVQWNLHSWSRFETDEAARTFRAAREGSVLEGHVLLHKNGFFSQSEGFDPLPEREKPSDQWLPQFHLRFTLQGYVEKANLAVLLCPGHAGRPPAAVAARHEGGTELAAIGDDRVLVNQGKGIDAENFQSSALAVVYAGGRQYEIGDGGIALK